MNKTICNKKDCESYIVTEEKIHKWYCPICSEEELYAALSDCKEEDDNLW